MVVVLGRAGCALAVERDQPVRLVRQEVDGPPDACRGVTEDLGDGLELRGVEDPARRVVWRVDQDGPRPRRDRVGQSLWVGREPRRIERQDDRDGLGAADQDVVEEPRRVVVDDLVAGLGDHPHRDRDRAPPAGRHGDVLLAPRKAGMGGQVPGDDLGRRGVIEHVDVPRRIPWLGMTPDGLDILGQRHVVRVAEQQIDDARLAGALEMGRAGVPRVERQAASQRCDAVVVHRSRLYTVRGPAV